MNHYYEELDLIVASLKATGKTKLDVATEFAATHFSERRSVGTFRPDGSFDVVGDTSSYRVLRFPGAGREPAATFVVYRA